MQENMNEAAAPISQCGCLCLLYADSGIIPFSGEGQNGNNDKCDQADDHQYCRDLSDLGTIVFHLMILLSVNTLKSINRGDQWLLSCWWRI